MMLDDQFLCNSNPWREVWKVKSLVQLEKELLEIVNLEGAGGTDGDPGTCPCGHDSGMTDCVTSFQSIP
jgi:hypothetical protein